MMGSNRLRPTIFLCVFILGIYSWFTTASGLIDIAGGNNWIFYFGLSLIIQILLIISSLYLVPQKGMIRLWPFFMFIYIVLFSLSVSMSINYQFRALGGYDDYAKQLFDGEYKKVATDATALNISYQKLAAQFDGLATFSKGMVDKENKHGGSCWKNEGANKRLGGGVYSNGGPYTQKRRYQADFFNDASASFKSGVIDVENILKQIEDLKLSKSISVSNKLRKLESLFNKLKGIYQKGVSQNGYRTILKKFIKFEFDGFPQSNDYSGFSGKKNACKDPSTVRKLKSTLLFMNEQPAVPTYDIRKIDSENKKETALLIATSFRDQISGFFTRKKTEDSYSIFATDMFLLPIFLGFMVDGLILVCGLLLRFSNTKSDYTRVISKLFLKLYPLFGKYPLYLNESEVSSSFSKISVGYASDTINYILRKILVEVKGESYLFYPHEKDEKNRSILSAEARRFIEMEDEILKVLDGFNWVGEPIANELENFKNFSFKHLQEDFQLSEVDFGDNVEFTVYYINREVFNILSSESSKNHSGFGESINIMSWYQWLQIPNIEYQDMLSMILENSSATMASYILERSRPSDIDGASETPYKLELYLTHQVDKKIISWLLNDEYGLFDLIREGRAKKLWLLPLPVRVFHLSNEAIDRLQDISRKQ